MWKYAHVEFLNLYIIKISKENKMKSFSSNHIIIFFYLNFRSKWLENTSLNSNSSILFCDITQLKYDSSLQLYGCWLLTYSYLIHWYILCQSKIQRFFKAKLQTTIPLLSISYSIFIKVIVTFLCLDNDKIYIQIASYINDNSEDNFRTKSCQYALIMYYGSKKKCYFLKEQLT